MCSYSLKMHQIHFRVGLCPDPTVQAHDALTDSLVVCQRSSPSRPWYSTDGKPESQSQLQCNAINGILTENHNKYNRWNGSSNKNVTL